MGVGTFRRELFSSVSAISYLVSQQRSTPIDRGGQLYALHPNPNDGHMALWQEVPDDKPVQVEVLDVVGRSVFKTAAIFERQSYQLDLNLLQPGVYVMNVLDNKGRRFMFKFVKQ